SRVSCVVMLRRLRRFTLFPYTTLFRSAFFGHPRGLSTMFFTEMWERFSWYGMRAILDLFLIEGVATGGMGMTAEQGGILVGIYADRREHTSELQSPDHIVCRLLLEKNK